MEYKFSSIMMTVTVLALICGMNGALAQEDRRVYEMPESGATLTFADKNAGSESGGLDPPAASFSGGYAAERPRHRFEMPESGLVIDFAGHSGGADRYAMRANRDEAARPSRLQGAAHRMTSFELPESGRLVVFPESASLSR